jgi:hypothetical protein
MGLQQFPHRHRAEEELSGEERDPDAMRATQLGSDGDGTVYWHMGSSSTRVYAEALGAADAEQAVALEILGGGILPVCLKLLPQTQHKTSVSHSLRLSLSLALTLNLVSP